MKSVSITTLHFARLCYVYMISVFTTDKCVLASHALTDTLDTLFRLPFPTCCQLVIPGWIRSACTELWWNGPTWFTNNDVDPFLYLISDVQDWWQECDLPSMLLGLLEKVT
jgi:hypothetical protein